jgi:Tfp pilus assembly protein PilX
VTVVLSMTVVTVIESSTSNQRSSTMTSGRSAAYNLAEAGLNNAMSILRLPTNNALDKYVFCADAASLPTLPVRAPTRTLRERSPGTATSIRIPRQGLLTGISSRPATSVIPSAAPTTRRRFARPYRSCPPRRSL